MNYTKHYSVLLNEVIDYIDQIEGKKLIADLTFGAGGHSFKILEKFPEIKLFSTDQDPDALKNGYARIEKENVGERIKLLDCNFGQFPDLVVKESWFKDHGGLDGILIDLGVSSHHFDANERGFSFRFEGPLDMRMNNRDSQETLTAKMIVNEYSEEEIADILYIYGEERLSRRIAKSICEKRKESEINTTLDLENIIFHAYPKNMRHGKINPCTRSFQALRIAVNDELNILKNVIPKLAPLLKKDGRIMIISFHSLEDRIVKHSFKGHEDLEVMTKKPVLPTEGEISENSRSRSAKMRVARKK